MRALTSGSVVFFSFFDYAQGTLKSVLFQRNGCALILAECARVGVEKCSFRAQRLAHFSTQAPPEYVSIWAVDGGRSGKNSAKSVPQYVRYTLGTR